MLFVFIGDENKIKGFYLLILLIFIYYHWIYQKSMLMF